MKKFLIVALFILTLCKDDEATGGWQKKSLNGKSYKDMDDGLVNAFKAALKAYIDKYLTDIDHTIDDLIPLTAYTQVVAGMLYNITFIDRKAEYPVIHHYQFFKHLPSEDEDQEEYELKAHKELKVNNGLIDFSDDSFTLLENNLHRLMKKDDFNLNYISYAYPVEDGNTVFFIIGADIDNTQHLCVMGQDKRSNKFDLYKIIKTL